MRSPEAGADGIGGYKRNFLNRVFTSLKWNLIIAVYIVDYGGENLVATTVATKTFSGSGGLIP